MNGNQILILNISDNSWKVSALSNIKIGGQYEKSLNKDGQCIRLIVSTEKYYII